ncbi:amidohydrolase family protein [Rhodococcus sp. IEGM 1381]|uniref:amidohydrolase family protein n=1 Tax=Rhodococcus sp. IEGM 1381 TaxID=3047085 RepID=UPI0024B66518|nr:amidohydrolase family protein [Rhodococcus sp. IEGM 1381]MDI9897419.1 amidohydrolase family protein [Rhodococcus sp. IEGM 1381]
MSLAIINIGLSHIGDSSGTGLAGDAMIIREGLIEWIGDSADVGHDDHEVLIDARGVGAVPGLIDSHVHSTFGDFTPRQQTVGFLESYVHGGVTRAISASEVHVPGRPTDPEGVKALAIAAQRSFQNFRPGGMTVHAGSVILEPGLTYDDFAYLREQGVWLAKGGFGAFSSPYDYVPIVRDARKAGIVVTVHTGGGSIPGTLERMDAAALLEIKPDVSFHSNGGPTAMTPEDNERLVVEGSMALQLVMAGNLRSSLDLCRLATQHGQLDRILIASDTPTGTGVVPLALWHLSAELVSLGGLSVEEAIASMTGRVADVFGLQAGRLEVGRPADLLLLDAPLGSVGTTWAEALEVGDVPGVCSAITDGVVRYTKSRNTPAAGRSITVRGHASDSSSAGH